MDLLYAVPVLLKLYFPINVNKLKINFQKQKEIEKIIPERQERRIKINFNTCV